MKNKGWKLLLLLIIAWNVTTVLESDAWWIEGMAVVLIITASMAVGMFFGYEEREV